MRQGRVIVNFGADQEFDLILSAADRAARTREAARDWFDREFIALECDVASPIGKVLSADRVLSVAKYAGARRFEEQSQWAHATVR